MKGRQKQLRDLEEDLELAVEHSGEISTQYSSEVSLYGDAWPGAQIDLKNADDTVASIRQAIKEAKAQLPKHTSGPWVVRPKLNNGFTVVNEFGRVVAGVGTVIRSTDHVFKRDAPRIEADARLISAAPDLLEILITLLDHGMIESYSHRKDAEDAVDKATGGEI